MGMNEADTRARLIDPALYGRGWRDDFVRREVSARGVEIVNGAARRGKSGRVDYTLRVKVSAGAQPVAVAVVEAKAEDLPPAHGLEQAKAYAASKRLNVPFVFATNGHQYVEFDRFSGKTVGPIPLDLFPDPDELRRRYEAGMGFKLDAPEARPLLTPYSGGEGGRRYYQDAAIRAVLERLAAGGRRALLSLATGAGKTYIAVNLLKRLADGGQLKRALFVCDRDELRTQAEVAFQAVFGADAAAVSAAKPQKNAKVLIATFQTLGVEGRRGEDDEPAADPDDGEPPAVDGPPDCFLTRNYPPDFFSHIIVDECHRSAWGKWSAVLTHNAGAVHVGLTATPRRLELPEDTPEVRADARITADNLAYFGDPVYEYDVAQGIDDGYLAACELRKGKVNIDDTGLHIDDIMRRKPRDARTGRPVTREELRELYERTAYEDRIILPDRVLAMCGDLFAQFLATGGPEQKTIIFCARDSHADAVAIEMNNLYADWCAANGKPPAPDYAFKCTAAAGGGEMVTELKGHTRGHFVATTVDLLTTGVDVPPVRNIVFFRYIKSPILFYQMVGRGTRIDEPSGKLMFRLYDYTDSSRLFGARFVTRAAKPPEPGEGPEGDGRAPPEPETVVEVRGIDVRVSEAGRYIVTNVDGKALPITVEEYKARLAAKLVAEAPTPERFRSLWIVPADRAALLAALPDGSRSVELLQALDGLGEFDPFDVLGELGYGIRRQTREERAAAFAYKNAGWLSKLPAATAATLKALAKQFAKGGSDGLDNQLIFQTPEVARAGGLAALSAAGRPADVLREAKERMFAS
jgi:type I restriction enzyme R subunit